MAIWLPRGGIEEGDGYYGETLLSHPSLDNTGHVLDHKLLAMHIIKLGQKYRTYDFTKNEDGWTVQQDGNSPAPVEDSAVEELLDAAQGTRDGPSFFGLVWNSDGTERIHSEDYEVGEQVTIEHYVSIERILRESPATAINNLLLSMYDLTARIEALEGGA